MAHSAGIQVAGAARGEHGGHGFGVPRPPAQLEPLIGRAFPLRNAAEAHTAIEARAATGKTLLVA